MVIAAGQQAFGPGMTDAGAGTGADAFAEGDWQTFLMPGSSAEFLAGWLALAGPQVSNARSGVLFLRGGGGGLGAAARWAPAGVLSDEMQEACRTAAETAAGQGTPAVHTLSEGAAVGYPLIMEGAVQAVLALTFPRHPGPGLKRTIRQMHWASGWIEAQLWRGRSAVAEHAVRTADRVLQLLASADSDARFDGAALGLVNAIPEITGFDSAALGMMRGRRMRLAALSRTASFKRRADHVAEFEAAMTEAHDQSTAISLPDPRDGHAPVDAAHRLLRDRTGSAAVVSVPLQVRGRPVGALTLLRRQDEDGAGVAVSADTLSGLILAAAAVAPVLKLKHDERRWLSGRGRDLLGRAVTAMLGRRPALSLLAIALAAALILPAFVTAPLRVRADAVLQGAEQRAAVAPVAGLLAESAVSAGDTVARGALLARLDDRDLRLERAEAAARLARTLQASRDALAEGDRAAAARAAAELREAEAALELVASRMARLEVRAPIDGIVISGDLSQRLGAPVDQGEVLFEIAELDEFRAMIDVSEFDLALVAPGQTGTLVLNGLPGRPAAFTVAAIASVSSPEGGENRFRVEADVTLASEVLRPGMAGIAKIETGEARLWHIIGRGTVQRLRMVLWRVLP